VNTSRDNLSKGTARIFFPKTKKGLDAVSKFADLIEEVCRRKVLSAGQCERLRRIKRDGDAIAHLADRHVKVLRPQGPGREDILWITEEQAWQDLEDTKDILLTMVEAIEKRPELMGPRSPWGLFL